MPTGLGRFYGAGYLHFISSSCYQRRPLLDRPTRRDLFLQILEQVRRNYRVVVVGYVAMPEHFHGQHRFYDFVTRSEKKRIEKLRYMHLNPVKRGLVCEPEQWAWSSFRHYAYDEAGLVLVNEQIPAELKIRSGRLVG
jgi:putative transposase